MTTPTDGDRAEQLRDEIAKQTAKWDRYASGTRRRRVGRASGDPRADRARHQGIVDRAHTDALRNVVP